jgi:hypothetical protein
MCANEKPSHLCAHEHVEDEPKHKNPTERYAFCTRCDDFKSAEQVSDTGEVGIREKDRQ